MNPVTLIGRACVATLKEKKLPASLVQPEGALGGKLKRVGFALALL